MSVATQERGKHLASDFRNTGQVAKGAGKPRLIAEAITVFAAIERMELGRCRVYDREGQERFLAAAEVFDICQSLDDDGRAKLRDVWDRFAADVREIAAGRPGRKPAA